jgi:thioredoxin-like negative regulator of GroEL
LWPEDAVVLNNLVYLLAQRRETLSRARTLLPLLLREGELPFSYYDTAAMVLMRSGELEQAEKWLEQAMLAVDMEMHGAHEVLLNRVELMIRQGRLDHARAALQGIRQDAARPDHVDRRAMLLLRDLDRP